MKKIALLAAAVAATLMCSAARVFAEQVSATIVKVTGSATVQIPGSPAPVVIKEGMVLPQGATIITAAGAEVHVSAMQGAVSTVRENTTLSLEQLTVARSGGAITKQNAVLHLKSGNVISTIDPAKRAINNYQVRTPKGVAAARGTAFSVSVSESGFSVTTTADSVVFTATDGTVYTIEAGFISIAPAGGDARPPVALAQVMTENPELAAILATAVETVGAVLRENLAGLSAESATRLAAQVVAVASAAAPAQAAMFTAELAAALTAPTAATAGNADAAALAVATVTAAGVQAAPLEAAPIAAAVAEAVPQYAGVAAAAASHVMPESGQAVIEAVAQATGQSATTVQSAALAAAAVAREGAQVAVDIAVGVATPVAPPSTPASNDRPPNPPAPVVPIINPGDVPVSPSS